MMKKVCLLNGSLRGENASSLQFMVRVSRRLVRPDFIVERLSVKSGPGGRYPAETLAVACGADAIIMAFPLFSYSLPGALMAFLEDFYAHVREGGSRRNGAKVFAIINCGFPEPRIMEEAIRVVKNFCARLGLSYRFSIAIATGPVTAMTMKVPLLNARLKKAFAGIPRDIAGDGEWRGGDVFIKPIIPKCILLRIKERYERRSLVLSHEPRDTA